MFPKIKHNKDIRSTIYYHRQKEAQRLAECLTAVNFVKDLESLSYEDMIFHFRRLTSLHESISNNVVHMSLSFHPSDKLSNKDMVDMAARFMEAVRLDGQPYLVYRHFDTIHPHVHLVTTNIQANGEQLKMSKADCHNAVQICRVMEKDYHLTASGYWRKQKHVIGQAIRFKHGEMGTMTAVNNILEKVVPQYKYTSLEELNAVLRLYNVEAYKGSVQSHLYHHKGLVYRPLDDKGHPINSYIKASLFDSKPTLIDLERRFFMNQAEALRQQHRQRVTAMLEWNIAKKMDLPGLEKALERQRISMVWEKDKEGRGERIFYVDHETRSVFDGSQLGTGYDAAALRARLVPVRVQEEKQVLTQQQRHRQSIKHGL